MARVFRLQRWSRYLLTFDANSDELVGYFVPPDEVDNFMKVFSPSTIVNLDEFPEHKDIEIFAVYPIGFDISLWHKNGFSTAEALDWVVTYNFSSVETACLWKAQRLLPEDAKRWLWFAGMTPETARKLVDLKMTKEGFKQWTQRYIRAIDAPEWIIAGFTPQEAKGWYEKKFTPRDALSIVL